MVAPWRMADGNKRADARRAAKGYKGPDLKDGNVDTSECVSLCPPHLQGISPGDVDKWMIWSMGVKNTFRQADGSGRNVFFTCSCETGSLECTSHLEIECAGLRFE